jgi:hypothetical protein
MWHRIFGAVLAIAALIFAWAKRKTISVMIGTITKAVSNRFWGYVRTHVMDGAPSNSNNRTYRR